MVVRYIYVCGLLAIAGAAQAGDYRPPRLADGQIDLQGVWSHKNITPLERPADLKSFVISREEAAQLQARLLAKTDDQSKPGEPAEYFWERGVEAIRGEYRSSIITDPADGRIPANDHFKTLAKATGAAVLTAFDGPEARPGSERCLAAISAAPPVTLVPASDLRQFVQTPQFIAISSEELHEARIVRMNVPHGPAAVVSWLGDSIGWWEGETLVVETTNFRPDQSFRASGQNLKVTERLTRVDPNQILYRFTVEDPDTFTQPFSGEVAMNATREKIYEYACHEGNYALPGILAGARAQEQEAAAKK